MHWSVLIQGLQTGGSGVRGERDYCQSAMWSKLYYHDDSEYKCYALQKELTRVLLAYSCQNNGSMAHSNNGHVCKIEEG